MRRRRNAPRSPRPPRGLGVVVLALIVAVVAWLVVARETSDDSHTATAVHSPPALKHRARHLRPSAGAPPPGIRLFGAKPLRVHFKHPPRAGILIDLGTGQALWAHRPLRRLPIASITKIMTAILVVERTQPTDRALITHEALDYQGSGVGVLPRGKHVPVEPLLDGMLLPSGNDAALALADHVAHTDRRFVRLMNARARAMGLGCTHYESADGIENGNRSCPADLAALARVAMSKPRIARIVRRPQIHVRFPIKTGRLWLYTTNPLLHMGYRGTIGLKTGSTNAAGHCFVGVVRRGSRTYAVVLLHSPDSGGQAKKLMDAAFRRR